MRLLGHSNVLGDSTYFYLIHSILRTSVNLTTSSEKNVENASDI